MLTIHDRDFTSTCAGPSRRELLRVGGLGMGALALPGLFDAHALASSTSATRKVVKDKAVVFLFLVGGPPQMETFDPKPNAPAAYRSCTGEVQTSIPGVLFGGTFPKLAQRADRLAIIRNFASTDGSHNQMPVLTGQNLFKAPMGSLYARAVGSLNVKTGLPTNTVIVPEAVDPNIKLGEPSSVFSLGYVQKNYVPAGSLGGDYDAFMPSGGSQLLRNLALKLPREHLNDRRNLLQQVDSLRRRLDRNHEFESVDAFQHQAYDVLLKGVLGAFDLSKEDPRTIAKYDTSGLFNMDDYHDGGKFYKKLQNQRRFTNLLGKQLLLARRLIENGCGFVTVADGCWDFHGDGNNPPNPVGMPVLGPQLDHAVSAFLDDLEDRGLSDKVLLVITGEMGRSSAKSGNGGTGHWADLTPLLLAGGGLKMGQVIGRSDAQSMKSVGERYTPENLLTTVLHTLFDAGELRIKPEALPSPVSKLVVDGQPIRELF